jgi:hypothetical protein
MNNKWIGIFAGVIVGAGFAGVANAQEKDEAATGRPRSLDAATRSVELTLGTGYSQGFGNVVSGQPTLTDIGQAGGAVEASVGYRIIPQLTLGVYGSGSMFSRGDTVDGSSNLYTATAGVKADWHFLPAGKELDPWLSLGTGWRGYWLNEQQGNTSIQGWEIAKLEVGLDYRIDRSVAVGPVVGADISTFFTQETPSSNGFGNISSPQASTFVFAGLQGRFDIPTGSDGSRVASR